MMSMAPELLLYLYTLKPHQHLCVLLFLIQTNILSGGDKYGFFFFFLVLF